MKRILLVVAYEGSRFNGWQVQPGAETVQGKLQEILARITGRPTKVVGSGRTDSQVHALGQIAHADIPAATDLVRLKGGLNGLGRPEIAVKELLEVPSDFHARHSATGKAYRYLIHNQPWPPVFSQKQCWWIRSPLDTKAMRLAAKSLLGPHDFSAFQARDCSAASPLRTLSRVDITEGKPDEFQSDDTQGSRTQGDGTLRIEMEGSGFLQHMARIITGTLTAVGQGRLEPGDVAEILASKDRARADITAPGKGLYLLQVHYDLNTFPMLKSLGNLVGSLNPELVWRG